MRLGLLVAFLALSATAAGQAQQPPQALQQAPAEERVKQAPASALKQAPASAIGRVSVAQVPQGEKPRAAIDTDALNKLLKAQTEAIQELASRMTALEERLAELESKRK